MVLFKNIPIPLYINVNAQLYRTEGDINNHILQTLLQSRLTVIRYKCEDRVKSYCELFQAPAGRRVNRNENAGLVAENKVILRIGYIRTDM